MIPGDPIGRAANRRLHGLFRRIGADGEAAVREQIAALTGSPSTRSLNEAQAWEFIEALAASVGELARLPICVEWCPVYTRGHVEPGALHASLRLPSQAQVWGLWNLFRQAGIAEPGAFLARRFGRRSDGLAEGVIRTAQDAWWVAKSLRAMADAPERGGRHAPEYAANRRARGLVADRTFAGSIP